MADAAVFSATGGAGSEARRADEVKRFIARGGMGEVFEGVNVNSDERVAIKVMLPALAADASVIALFRKEAKTLTKFSHDALVKYRTLAQEPQLGVLYIVTEFIDGTNLSDVLGEVMVALANARAVGVIGVFNNWHCEPLYRLDDGSGRWSGFIEGARPGHAFGRRRPGKPEWWPGWSGRYGPRIWVRGQSRHRRLYISR